MRLAHDLAPAIVSRPIWLPVCLSAMSSQSNRRDIQSWRHSHCLLLSETPFHYSFSVHRPLSHCNSSLLLAARKACCWQSGQAFSDTAPHLRTHPAVERNNSHLSGLIQSLISMLLHRIAFHSKRRCVRQEYQGLRFGRSLPSSSIFFRDSHVSLKTSRIFCISSRRKSQSRPKISATSIRRPRSTSLVSAL